MHTVLFCKTICQIPYNRVMQWLKKYAKRIGFDVAGYTLIVLGLAFGWVPGPGGIPLILGGLALLAVHNHWARRLLVFAKEQGDKLVYIVFPDNKIIQALHDVLVVVLLVIGITLVIVLPTIFTFGIMVAFFAIAIADFCFNRHRLDRWRNRNKC